MQAAITAAERGHAVTLVEKSGALGGLLRFTGADSVKPDLRRFKEFLMSKIGGSNAKILLNTEPTDALIESLRPDNIIVATGSEPVVPARVKGVENARHALEVYLDAGFAANSSFVIVGGGLAGVETGLHLANIGKSVAVLELGDDFARDSQGVYKISLMIKLGEAGVNVITGARVKEITSGGVVYEKGGKTETARGTALYAVGMKPRDSAYFDLCGKAPFVELIGDAKTPGKVAAAIHSGFFAAMDIGAV
jgi:pyruvate/2-oxoglutarate dehydrogenase complex dihydrolipoamide dehydrogenase (E3) component